MSSVRLIAGKFGGRSIASPHTSRTHPMSERVRGALFNMVSVDDLRVLDACAGTGALGLEALSRGAREVVFIERDRVAQKVLAETIAMLGVTAQTTVIKASIAAWHDTSSAEKFDLIFCDPPYHDMQFSTVVKLFSHLKPDALMVLSHPGRSETPTADGVVVVDNRTYGDAALTFYRRR